MSIPKMIPIWFFRFSAQYLSFVPGTAPWVRPNFKNLCFESKRVERGKKRATTAQFVGNRPVFRETTGSVMGDTRDMLDGYLGVSRSPPTDAAASPWRPGALEYPAGCAGSGESSASWRPVGRSPTRPDIPRAQRRNARQPVEVPIDVQHVQSIANRAGGDQAIDARPDRHARPSCRSVQVDCS
jgi:hypothetical protein